jgi:hypothetical protein
VKVSFYSEYYLSILITVDLKLDFDIAYGVGETRTQNQWTIGGFSRKSLFSK